MNAITARPTLAMALDDLDRQAAAYAEAAKGTAYAEGVLEVQLDPATYYLAEALTVIEIADQEESERRRGGNWAYKGPLLNRDPLWGSVIDRALTALDGALYREAVWINGSLLPEIPRLLDSACYSIAESANELAQAIDPEGALWAYSIRANNDQRDHRYAGSPDYESALEASSWDHSIYTSANDHCYACFALRGEYALTRVTEEYLTEERIIELI